MGLEMSVPQLLSKARVLVNSLTENLPQSVDPASLSWDAKLPTKVMCYREVLIWRTEELCRASLEQYERFNIAAAITLTRSAMEGVATTWHLKKLVEKTVEDQSVIGVDCKIMRLLMGSKNETTGVRAFNVLNFIDNVEKKISGFRKSYDSLSEYAHPNWAGTTQIFAKFDHESLIVELGRDKQGRVGPQLMGLHTLVDLLEVYIDVYDAIMDLLPEFIHLCDADLGSGKSP